MALPLKIILKLSAHFDEGFFQFQVKDIIPPASDDVFLLIGLSKITHCLQYITFLSLWDLQCILRKYVLNGLNCNVPSQGFQRRWI